jgi:hypothetical protein
MKSSGLLNLKIPLIKIKKALTEAPVLIIPDYSKYFYDFFLFFI